MPGLPVHHHSLTLRLLNIKLNLEVMNRFKGLDLVDKVPEELWAEIRNIVQETVTQTIQNKKKSKKAKWLSEESS